MRRAERFPGHQFPQIVPEPDEVRPGGPVPWAHLDARDRRLGVAEIVERLVAAGRALDGATLAAVPAELDPANGQRTRRSAVLVALFEEAGDTRLVLTRRSSGLRHHRGEIALPGGRAEEGEDDVATALREAEEEVGLDPALVEPVARLSPLVTFVSGSAIWPVVGRLAAPPTLVPRAAEVERILTVSLFDLLEPGAAVVERWRRDPHRPGADDEGFVPMFFYRIPGELVWGATARVLTELLCLATGVEWPGDPRVGGRSGG